MSASPPEGVSVWRASPESLLLRWTPSHAIGGGSAGAVSPLDQNVLKYDIRVCDAATDVLLTTGTLSLYMFYVADTFFLFV